MPITLSLRDAIVHKVHDKSDDQLREMIEGSVDLRQLYLDLAPFSK